jgi:hypothetical protein
MTAEVCIDFRTVAESGPEHLPRGLPLIITGGGSDVPLLEWVQSQRERLKALLCRSGALLFRGCGAQTPESFGQLAAALSDTAELMGFVENTSPRRTVLGNIKTSTDYPEEQTILLHNEHSYSRVYPAKLFFACKLPPMAGGCTLLAHCRAVLGRLHPAIVKRFQRVGWMYVRNFRGTFGPTWQDVFQTSSREAVVAHCRTADIACEWGSDGALTIRHVRQAVHRHPLTHEFVWFNHIAFWHVSSLAEPIRTLVLSEFSEDNYPHNTYYGDGSNIEPSVLCAIRDAYAAETVGPVWQRDDVMVLDNVLIAHGREPFRSPREIWFAMTDPNEQRGAA